MDTEAVERPLVKWSDVAAFREMEAWENEGGYMGPPQDEIGGDLEASLRWAELQKAFDKWLLISDRHLLHVILASIVANQFDGDPLWLLLVAPPSSAKTEMLRALSSLEHVLLLSNLTPNTFLSGKLGKGDASLLPHLSGKVLAMKDFTTVLTLHRDARAEIFAQLREIYDGSYSKAYGTGDGTGGVRVVRWEGKVGFTAGVTGVIDSQTAVHSVLGERFLLYRPETENRQEVARRAVKNTGTEGNMRKELAEAVKGFFGSLRVKTPPELTPDTVDALIVLADLTAKGRAGVARDGYERTLQYKAEPEIPARLAKQLTVLGQGLAAVAGKTKVGSEELMVLRKVALHSMIQQRVALLRPLANLQAWETLTTAEVATEAVTPTRTVLELLEDCWTLGMVDRERIGGATEEEDPGRRGRSPYRWKLKADVRDDIGKVRLFTGEVPF